MLLKSFFPAGLVASAAAAATSSPLVSRAALGGKVASGEVPLCGNEEPSESHKAFSKAMLENEKTILRMKQAFTVDVYFHVVSSSTSAEDGNISDDVISEQIDIINTAYAPHDISFNLVETTRTVNSDWTNGLGIDTMKSKLRKGPYAALNVYVVNEIGNGVLGFCPFPEQVTEGDDVFNADGCTINVGTMPGGDISPYNQGGTLVHEIGHWMNVYHTFQDGCSPGDLVNDTPAQGEVGRECNPDVVYDTCPNDPGTDPIHNWMNYTGDQCWEEFTPGQEARMHSAWDTYRSPGNFQSS